MGDIESRFFRCTSDVMFKRGVEMIDYAYPTMMAEKALRELHEAMLANKFESAKEAALRCISEARIAYHSITEMETENAAKASARA